MPTLYERNENQKRELTLLKDTNDSFTLVNVLKIKGDNVLSFKND